jgi:hypothetical protein
VASPSGYSGDGCICSGTFITNFGRPSLKNCGLPCVSVCCWMSPLPSGRVTMPTYVVPTFLKLSDLPPPADGWEKKSSMRALGERRAAAPSAAPGSPAAAGYCGANCCGCG